MDKNNIRLPRAAIPEEAGVSSEIILHLLEDMEKSEMEFHSFMVIRHGKVAAECFRAPFSENRPHAMYSVSKTVTATAIGIAVQEGYISLSDKVRDIFPDYTEKLKDNNLDKLTIGHLITMTSGKAPSVFADKSKVDWIKHYFESPWYNEPGKEFRYINENIYILAVIIKRKTGLCVREFLRPRLFEPLGIEYPFWETDNSGTEAGGWGLYLKTEDLAKIMLTYSQGGVFNGKQILSEEWVKAASMKQADTTTEFDSDAKAGYGYCLWRCDGANAYRADGMFSQFGIVFEDYDAVLIVTSAIALEQEARDLLWKYFPAAFIEESQQASPAHGTLKIKLLCSAVEKTPPKTSSPTEKLINGKEIRFRKKILLNIIGFPMSMLPLAVTYMTTDKAGNIDRMVFSFNNSECTLTWSEGDERNTIPVGMDGKYRYGTMRLGKIDYKVCSTAQWYSDDTLFIKIRPIETIANRKLKIRFYKNGKVRMKPSSDPNINSIAMSLAAGFENMIGNKMITNRIIPLFRYASDLLEPAMKGKIR